MNRLLAASLAILWSIANCGAVERRTLLIERLDGPVTPAEIAAFKAFMEAAPLPTTNEHDAFA